MEANNTKLALLIITFCSLIFFDSAEAVCVPRNNSGKAASSAPMPSSPKPKPKPKPTPSPTPKKEAAPTPKAAPTRSHISAPTPSESVTFNRESPRGTLVPGHDLQVREDSATTAANPLMKHLCDATDYPDVCMNALAPLGQLVDPIKALEAAIKVATDQTNIALDAATKMADAPGTSPSVSAILYDCEDFYGDALDNFQSALDAIPSRDLGTIRSMLSAAVTDWMTCDDGFTSGVSLMKQYSDNLVKLGSNCLSLSTMIK
ncbi:PMEI domain-containing protein [Cephalotus follicularis]|uniref:PMEI domain-containing protein n=1 Tax=Cephalotus follicularis TaxID=3775 RepID=A0A1Q3BSZ2_CEPFO|nr:PMEI domain-containing protein [Cephalotus follicularis]